MDRPLLSTWVALGLAALALAARAQTSGPYVALGGGESHTSHALVENREATIVNATDIHTQFDADAGAWKALAGYAFTPWLAFEAGYADLGRHQLSTTMLGGDPPLPAGFVIRRRIRALGGDVVVRAPVGTRFALFARGGAWRTRLDAEATLSGNVVFTTGTPDERSRTVTRHDTVAHYGAGGECSLTPQLALRLEWERFANVGKAWQIGGVGTTGRADTDLYTLGVIYRFR